MQGKGSSPESSVSLSASDANSVLSTLSGGEETYHSLSDNSRISSHSHSQSQHSKKNGKSKLMPRKSSKSATSENNNVSEQLAPSVEGDTEGTDGEDNDNEDEELDKKESEEEESKIEESSKNNEESVSDRQQTNTVSQFDLSPMNSKHGKINFEPLKCYLNCGNYISAIFRKCFLLEDPEKYQTFMNIMIQQLRDFVYGINYETPRSAAFEEKDQVDAEMAIKNRTFETTRAEFERNVYISKERQRDESRDTFYISDEELKEFGISQIIYAFMFSTTSIT